MAISGTNGSDQLQGTPGNDEINGRLGDDTLIGFDGDDLLKGSGGDDLLRGGAGDDTLRGGADQDTLRGGTGNDLLLAGTGDDILEGGKGDDTLRGGDGADRFIFGNNFGNDVVLDLDFNGGDTIFFSNQSLEITDSGELATLGLTLETDGNDDTSVTIEGRNAKFDFGGGNMITFQGVANDITFQDFA